MIYSNTQNRKKNTKKFLVFHWNWLPNMISVIQHLPYGTNFVGTVFEKLLTNRFQGSM